MQCYLILLDRTIEKTERGQEHLPVAFTQIMLRISFCTPCKQSLIIFF